MGGLTIKNILQAITIIFQELPQKPKDQLVYIYEDDDEEYGGRRARKIKNPST
jgi:hypothetical protein